MTTAALIEEAFAHHRAGQLDLAEALYRKTLEQDEDNLNALQLLGALTCDSGRGAEAVGFYRRAASLLQARGDETVSHAAFYYNFGTALAVVGRGGEAIEVYRHGVGLNPALPELHAALAAEFKREGNLQGAVAEYENALQLAPERPEWLHSLADCCAALGGIERAIALYRRAVELDPRRLDSLRMLGMGLLAAGRPEEAIAALDTLAACRPDDIEIFAMLGKAQFGAGQLAAARSSFERVLGLRPDDAEAHWVLGSISHAERDFESAERAYRHALERQPDLAGALFNLGMLLHCERDRPGDAVPFFERLIAVAPEHVEAHRSLADAYRSLMRFPEAVASYRAYLARLPDSPLAHLLVGETLSESGRKQEAIPYFEKTLALDPADRMLAHLAHVGLGSALQSLGQVEAGLAQFKGAVAIEPLLTRRAVGGAADFSVLLVMAPAAFNTPYQYLIEQASYDSHILMLLPETDYDPAMLAARCDVVVNLISDVDQENGMLAVAAALIDRIGRPVVNHPRTIAPTSRESVAQVLSGIPSCRIARVSRHNGGALASPDFQPEAAGLPLPFLARRAGCHGGDEFELISAPGDLERLVADHGEDDYYVIEYLDYRSPDGFFRKYRFFFVGDEILPYHLSIGAEWKVHHFRTDILNQPWMQREEEAFLDHPDGVFGPEHFAALRRIRDILAIDFFGIDCSLDRAGNLVVFEANATMLVHGMNRDFPYKVPHARRIKAAFAALLANRSSGAGATGLADAHPSG